jgi:hypothetical protein
MVDKTHKCLIIHEIVKHIGGKKDFYTEGGKIIVQNLYPTKKIP